MTCAPHGRRGCCCDGVGVNCVNSSVRAKLGMSKTVRAVWRGPPTHRSGVCRAPRDAPKAVPLGVPRGPASCRNGHLRRGGRASPSEGRRRRRRRDIGRDGPCARGCARPRLAPGPRRASPVTGRRARACARRGAPLAALTWSPAPRSPQTTARARTATLRGRFSFLPSSIMPGGSTNTPPSQSAPLAPGAVAVGSGACARSAPCETRTRAHRRLRSSLDAPAAPDAPACCQVRPSPMLRGCGALTAPAAPRPSPRSARRASCRRCS